MVMSLSIDLEVDRIKRCCSANKKSIALHATKRQIRHHLGNFYFTDVTGMKKISVKTVRERKKCPRKLGQANSKI